MACRLQSDCYTWWFMHLCYNPSDYNLLSRSKALLPKRLVCTPCACTSPAPRVATIVSSRNNEIHKKQRLQSIHSCIYLSSVPSPSHPSFCLAAMEKSGCKTKAGVGRTITAPFPGNLCILWNSNSKNETIYFVLIIRVTRLHNRYAQFMTTQRSSITPTFINHFLQGYGYN